MQLGMKLKYGKTQIVKAGPQVNKQVQVIPEEAESSNYDLSTEARINLDIDRLIKQLRHFSNKLQEYGSDFERKQVWKEASSIQDRIEYNKKLLRQLAKGQNVNYSNTYFQNHHETDFDVPENILGHNQKYRYMMSLRSKRKVKIEQALSNHGQDSPQHQHAVADWKHYDDVVKHLKTKLDERTR